MNLKEKIHSYFSNRIGVLATMHQKERVMTPLLEKELGIKLIIPDDLNTDKFGTFTREVDRAGDQLDAARMKAKEGLRLTGEKLAFASEGSFGPHPTIPFASVNMELVLMVDVENEIEVIGESVSFSTNYAQNKITSFEEAYDFAIKAGFPDHGMVIRSKETTNKEENIIKGITSKKDLEAAVRLMLNKFPFGQVFLETDMRAMYNPARMEQIKAATIDLVKNINHLCPSCSIPGFKLSERKKGLPCKECGFPTNLIQSHIYTCSKCEKTEERLFPTGKEIADPSQCMFCNP